MNALAMWLEDGSPEQQGRDAMMKVSMEAQKQHFDDGIVRLRFVLLLCLIPRSTCQMKGLWEETALGKQIR